VTFDHPPINTVTATTIRELFDGPRAELYGYVNRAIADDELDEEVEAIASRLARFDREAIARTKSYVDQITLPPDSELPPALTDFRQAAGRPGPRARLAKLEELGLNVDSDLERRLESASSRPLRISQANASTHPTLVRPLEDLTWIRGTSVLVSSAPSLIMPSLRSTH